MTDTPTGLPGDRLRAIADGFLCLRRQLDHSNPVAGVQSLDALARHYGAAQELGNSALFLLLTASTHPLAMNTVEGHYAVESLGHCVQLGVAVTERLASALRVAAQYHRIDGVNPSTRRLEPRRPERQEELTQHLKAAVPLAEQGYARASDAAQFLDAAQQRRRTEAEAGGQLLYSGRRLLLTQAGEQALATRDAAAPAPSPSPRPPARPSSSARSR
ncbi:hypothetical protein [Streptomyces sp. NPDC059928]|uniref:hypothetical protein n=1 Tax=unclassified Streptomyces TaxID=2593676 RepID=UPI0036684179